VLSSNLGTISALETLWNWIQHNLCAVCTRLNVGPCDVQAWKLGMSILNAVQYPEVVAHHDMMAETKGIKAYIDSGKRFEKVNNNNVG
jgi:hypothetical protein